MTKPKVLKSRQVAKMSKAERELWLKDRKIIEKKLKKAHLETIFIDSHDEVV